MGANATPKILRLYNTMSRSIEQLKPIENNHVRIYCCGPTVYNYQHVGNLRTYIFEDILVRTLRYAGYKITHAMNITDVGHLVSDADDGEDKMAVAVRREGKQSIDIASYYTDIFFDHCAWLNITRPDIVCKATEHVEQMIEVISQLFEKGFAYVSGGNVYFDISRLPDYGKLARLNLDNLQAGARIAVDKQKRNPQDFALWFTRSKFENQDLQWDSPWGKGYPGWHIECSAMSMKYLGEHFDIHCGGIDHIPVHHTNEIAQSEAASGKCFANVWMHGGFLIAGKNKMSKSSGEFLTLDVIKERGFDPMSYRLFCLSGTYRNELTWGWKAIESSQNSLNKIKNAVIELKSAASKKTDGGSDFTDKQAQKQFILQFDDAVLNDLAMPRALSVFHAVFGDNGLSPNGKLELLLHFDQVLGLGIDSWEASEIYVPAEVSSLVKERETARHEKRWSDADALRDKILDMGFIVEDSKDGSKIKSR